MRYEDEEQQREYLRQVERIQNDKNRIKFNNHKSYNNDSNSDDSFTYENADFEVDDEDEDEISSDEMLDENEYEQEDDNPLEEKAEEEIKNKLSKNLNQPGENGGNFIDKIKGSFNKTGGTGKGEAAKKAGQAATKAGKAVGKGFAHVFKFLFTPPVLYYTLIVLGIILLVVLIVVLIMLAMNAASAPFANTNVANGQFDTSAGITGANFYGARVVYYDEEKAVQELNNYYYSFAVDYINQIDSIDGIELSQDFDTTVANIQLSIANIVSTEEDKTNIIDLLPTITHFGYTYTELTCIKDYFLNNTNIFIIDNSIYTYSITDDIENLFNTRYSSLDITAPLYYVKDLILQNEEDMIAGLSQDNYVAFIYMPKTTINFEIAEYMFYIPYAENENADNYTPSINSSVYFEFIEHSTNGSSILYSNTADPTWWGESSAETTAEITIANPIINSFNSIDTTNLNFLNGQSLYSILVGNINETSEENTEENQNNETITNNIVSFVAKEENITKYFTIVETTNEDTSTNKELTYLPSQDSSYIYLTFNSICNFQFAEFSVDCEEYIQ